jgi:hypothetical protein
MKTANAAISAAYPGRRGDRDQAARLRPQLIAPKNLCQWAANFAAYLGRKKITKARERSNLLQRRR